MRYYINRARELATSATAKDTYILFAGNLASAFLGFVFTLLIARGLAVSDFGVFSAVNNLVTIIVSVSDIGISAGLVNFIAGFQAKKDHESSSNFLKASILIRILAMSVLVIWVLLFPRLVALRLLATSDVRLSYWVAILSFGLLLWSIFPSVLQASKKFFASVIVDNSLGLTRILLVVLFIFLGGLTISRALASFTAGAIVAGIIGLSLIGTDFIRAKPAKKIYGELLKFSGWVGVNRIISAFSGRLDIQMLAAIAGAAATGIYSISSKLALFIVVLTASFSSVLAPRLASFGDKETERKYILKAFMTTIPIITGVIIWIIFARPFVLILFGNKYLGAVPVFQALAASMIPFILTAPSVAAIIYAMKKPVYIGVFSIYQLVILFVANLILIPKIGAFGPTVAFAIVNTSLAVYTWVIVIRHYWRKQN